MWIKRKLNLGKFITWFWNFFKQFIIIIFYLVLFGVDLSPLQFRAYLDIPALLQKNYTHFMQEIFSKELKLGIKLNLKMWKFLIELVMTISYNKKKCSGYENYIPLYIDK